MPPRPPHPNPNVAGGGYQPQSYNSPPPSSQQSNFSNQNTYGQPAPRQQHYQQNAAPAFQPQPSRRMRAIKSPNESFALTNRVASSPNEFPPHTRYVLVEHQYVFSIQYACTFFLLLIRGSTCSQKGRHFQLTVTPRYLMIHIIGQITQCKSHVWDSATCSESGSTSDSTRRSTSLLGTPPTMDPWSTSPTSRLRYLLFLLFVISFMEHQQQQ